ncbi:hypothetical protein BKP37_09840 [Anaerobacillus alkalilacustris]|uniref:Uncharacterized protein n=1 Tax=Anaerobacillus alkalilacustris TaxID=393763 RepID=A0A1S2LM22_9BACI|nr:hypothetical protein BKP37_09840 [Anaerobacillus alkalilacustris]
MRFSYAWLAVSADHVAGAFFLIYISKNTCDYNVKIDRECYECLGGEEKVAKTPRPTKGSKDPQVMGERSVNPMGVSPDHEFSTEPLSKGALVAKKKNTK